MAMDMDSVRNIAGKYGVDLAGIRVTIFKNKAGLCGITPNAQNIQLWRDAFFDEETLARTLAHERHHVDQIRNNREIPRDEEGINRWEEEAYDFEDNWWNNHPNNNPPEGDQ